MRSLFLLITLVLPMLASSVRAQPPPYHAGIARIQVAADQPLDALVWYPTQAQEVPWQAASFSIPATRDARVAPGRFPVVLLSHGGGATGGSPLLLRDLSAHLAREGFIVVAPFHGKTRLPPRSSQVAAAFDAMMADPRFKEHAASGKLGMLGFSLGGAVTLGLAGGVPNFKHLAVYCAAHRDDVLSCGAGPSGDKDAASPRAAASASALSRLPLQALVLLDPFGVPFQRDGLATVKMPVLLFRPEQSKLGEENTRALVAGLPQPPQVRHVPGGHFVFTDICSATLKGEAPDVCDDPLGVNRAAVHADVETRITKFFRENL